MDLTRLSLRMRVCVFRRSIRESVLSFRPIATRSADGICTSNWTLSAVGRRGTGRRRRPGEFIADSTIGHEFESHNWNRGGERMRHHRGINRRDFFWLIVGHVAIGF